MRMRRDILMKQNYLPPHLADKDSVPYTKRREKFIKVLIRINNIGESKDGKTTNNKN